jgi:S1-C subfamily serine protease
MRDFFTARAIVIIAAAIVALPLVAGSAAAQAVPESRAEISLSFAPIVKRAAPAVVNVYAQRIVRQPGFRPFGDDPLFRHFFGDDGFFGGPRERVQNSLGSGVIVDDSGFVVTNHHVIKGGTDIRVVLSDKREFEATVLLNDERTDIAVLKIEPGSEPLPILPLGDSDALEVGDLVLAIGNPFGVGQTVTSGIVSALARTEVGITDYQFFVQTDAAINPGNSGGALIDMGRPPGGHQHGDLFAQRRFDRYRIRHPRQHGEGGDPVLGGHRPGGAPVGRGGDPGGHPRHRPGARP